MTTTGTVLFFIQKKNLHEARHEEKGSSTRSTHIAFKVRDRAIFAITAWEEVCGPGEGEVERQACLVVKRVFGTLFLGLRHCRESVKNLDLYFATSHLNGNY